MYCTVAAVVTASQSTPHSLSELKFSRLLPHQKAAVTVDSPSDPSPSEQIQSDTTKEGPDQLQSAAEAAIRWLELVQWASELEDRRRGTE